jgi:hypothetical protein
LGVEDALVKVAGLKTYALDTLIVLDLVGTFVFALSGATAGVRKRLDLFGVLVLSFVAAVSGCGRDRRCALLLRPPNRGDLAQLASAHRGILTTDRRPGRPAGM